MRRRWRIVAIVILLILAAFVVARTSSSFRHTDGTGPLASRNGPGHDSFYTAWVQGVSAWTFGVPLCLAQGSTPAVIESVAPETTIGSGFAYLGAKARAF